MSAMNEDSNGNARPVAEASKANGSAERAPIDEDKKRTPNQYRKLTVYQAAQKRLIDVMQLFEILFPDSSVQDRIKYFNDIVQCSYVIDEKNGLRTPLFNWSQSVHTKISNLLTNHQITEKTRGYVIEETVGNETRWYADAEAGIKFLLCSTHFFVGTYPYFAQFVERCKQLKIQNHRMNLEALFNLNIVWDYSKDGNAQRVRDLQYEDEEKKFNEAFPPSKAQQEFEDRIDKIIESSPLSSLSSSSSEEEEKEEEIEDGKKRKAMATFDDVFFTTTLDEDGDEITHIKRLRKEVVEEMERERLGKVVQDRIEFEKEQKRNEETLAQQKQQQSPSPPPPQEPLMYEWQMLGHELRFDLAIERILRIKSMYHALQAAERTAPDSERAEIVQKLIKLKEHCKKTNWFDDVTKEECAHLNNTLRLFKK